MKLKITVFFFVACMQQAPVFSQTNPLVNYLPERASMVMSISAGRLGSKIPRETFLQSSLYREMIKDSSKSQANAFFKDPARSGIDFSTDILLATVIDTTGGQVGSSVHIFGRLNNESLFSSLVKDLFKNDSVSIFGTNKILFKERSTLAWSNDLFVYSSGSNYNNLLKESFFSSTDTSMMKHHHKSMKKAN